MDKNKFYFVAAFVIFILITNLVGYKVIEKVLVNKVSQQVMEQLRRDYVPGPYSPGFDPDKVNPRVFKK